MTNRANQNWPNGEATVVCHHTFSREWFDGMRDDEASGKLRFTVKQIAERELAKCTPRAVAAMIAGNEMEAYCWASLAASCGLELLGR